MQFETAWVNGLKTVSGINRGEPPSRRAGTMADKPACGSPLNNLLHSTSDNQSWQAQLREVVTDPAELLGLLQLTPADLGLARQACESFPLRVPRAFVSRMRPGDPADPLLRQVLASAEELLVTPGYSEDPLAETGEANARPGIIHKYQGRALLLVTGSCAVNCRYCFRRHFPYEENRNSREQWREALTYIAQDQSITEVILSGGDPLVAADRFLLELCEEIAGIAHVETLRIHTRLPIVLPARVTAGLRKAIASTRLRLVVVVHCNHPNEIDTEVANAMVDLRGWGATLLNQAVLLAGVNDSVQTQVELSEALHHAGVLPYYLHLLDPVQGAQHFDVEETVGIQIVRDMTAQLPGYLVPKLVREVPGEAAKSGIPLTMQV
jgi:L-lysine 2,3-aminomutase